MIEKTVQESITEQVHILMPENLNGYGRLFGGRLMQWIDVVVLEGRILRVGNTSMEVQVDTFVERPGERVHINRAKLVMVALDENERPTPVPKLRADE